MNWKRIGDLVWLRYKLTWAKTRSRDGRIALLIIGYLLFAMAAGLVSIGGVGAGIMAIRTGKAETIAQIVLSGLFMNAVMATILLGFGVNSPFSDTELLRYPLRARERFVARHFLGAADPFWILVLLLEFGLIFGMYVWGAYSLGYGMTAALLLFVSGYLIARMLGVWGDRLMTTRSGSGLVLLVVVSLLVLPRRFPRILGEHAGAGKQLLTALQFTPPFAAAAAITHTGKPAFTGLGLLVLWSIGAALLLTRLEKRPTPRQQMLRVTTAGKADLLERLSRLFPADTAPLVSHWLRFFVRNKRFRMLSLLSLPLAAYLTYNLGQLPKGNGTLFVAALGTLPLVTFLGVSRITVNLYGYMGDAFRRFLLFPTAPAASLRAGSYASLLLGTAALLAASIAWIVFAPGPFDLRVILLPVINSITVLFLFNSAGIWTSLFGARRGNYDKAVGNDMSLAGNIVVIGSALACISVPQILRRIAPNLVSLETRSSENWWLLLPAMFAVGVYLLSLHAASAMFGARRERLLAVMEGKA